MSLSYISRLIKRYPGAPDWWHKALYKQSEETLKFMCDKDDIIDQLERSNAIHHNLYSSEQLGKSTYDAVQNAISAEERGDLHEKVLSMHVIMHNDELRDCMFGGISGLIKDMKTSLSSSNIITPDPIPLYTMEEIKSKLFLSARTIPDQSHIKNRLRELVPHINVIEVRGANPTYYVKVKSPGRGVNKFYKIKINDQHMENKRSIVSHDIDSSIPAQDGRSSSSSSTLPLSSNPDDELIKVNDDNYDVMMDKVNKLIARDVYVKLHITSRKPRPLMKLRRMDKQRERDSKVRYISDPPENYPRFCVSCQHYLDNRLDDVKQLKMILDPNTRPMLFCQECYPS
jgi:hypothetical protein